MALKIVSQFLSQKAGASVFLIAVLVAGIFMALFVSPSYMFIQSEGPNRPSLKFSEMETKTLDGRTTHMLRLGLLTPDDRVTFSVWSPVIVVGVDVLGSDGKVLYPHEERNGTLGGDIRLFHSSDVTVRITEICSPCKYTGWEYVSYAQYSLYPYIEIVILSAACWMALFLLAVGNWLFAIGRLRVRRWWLLSILVPVGLAFYALYVWAFNDANYLAFALAALTTGLAIFLALAIRGPHTLQMSGGAAQTVDPIAIAKRYVQTALQGKMKMEGWRADVSPDGNYFDVKGLVILSPFETHDVWVHMTKEGRVTQYTLQ